jgi:hypothetical protein
MWAAMLSSREFDLSMGLLRSGHFDDNARSATQRPIKAIDARFRGHLAAREVVSDSVFEDPTFGIG